MLQLKKKSPFEATILLAPAPDAVESLFTIVKGTFLIGENVIPLAKQLPIVMADKFYSDPGQSSIETPGDVGLIKPGTDVVLKGTAVAPGERPTRQMDVTLRVGAALKKTVRVFGDRVWSKGLLGAKISEPEPFTRIPLTWERAFGGSDATEGKQPKISAENRNPVGRGFRIKNGQKELEGLKLPNLESPGALIRSWTDCPTPAAFAPVSAHWEPRKGYAGTYDEAWQKNRSPYLPLDFDSRFFQLAPPDQISRTYLSGGEDVEINGVTSGGALRFRIPQHRFDVVHRLDAGNETRPANLDLVLIEPDESRLVLVWRAAFKCDKKAMKVREIEVALKPSR